MVRTPGFHPGNRGSIPLGAASMNSDVGRYFYFIKKAPLENSAGLVCKEVLGLLLKGLCRAFG